MRMVPELTDVEDGEDVKVTQRMAVDALARYAKAHEAEKTAKNEKASISAAILKPYLKDNPHETLYDGETGYEGRLVPHGTGRHLDAKAPDGIVLWAFRAGLLNLALGKMDEMPDSPAVDTLEQFVNPGGEGEARLKVSKRDERS